VQLACVKYTEKINNILKIVVINIVCQYIYFFCFCILKEQYIYKVLRLKNALFHNKIHLKKDYFVKEIDLPEVFSQRESPFFRGPQYARNRRFVYANGAKKGPFSEGNGLQKALFSKNNAYFGCPKKAKNSHFLNRNVLKIVTFCTEIDFQMEYLYRKMTIFRSIS
jgi:hypothetical protein